MRFFVSALLVTLLIPGAALAAPAFEVSGWIPYWRAPLGMTDVTPRLRQVTTVMPFGYIVQNDGSLSDAFGIEASTTVSQFIAAAKASGTRVVPTVMWSNGDAIHTILSSAPARRALEDQIAALAKTHGFDGIDIDFEGKYAKTKPSFSLFLQGLYQRMGPKWVYCTIEARTPDQAAFDVVPADLQRANDFKAVNKYCDRVNLMTYDQGTIDLRLNAAQGGQPYIPVSDPQWVAKVALLASQDIAKSKIVIGVPTYGYEYDLMPLSISGYKYDLDWAFNPRYATDLAATFGITPVRNSAGELSFTYQATSTADGGALGSRIVWWSDAQAIQGKINLAKTLGLRGVALFKLDGGEDPGLWNYLPLR